VLFSDQLIRANLFYAPLKHPETFRVNSFLSLETHETPEADREKRSLSPEKLNGKAKDKQKSHSKGLTPHSLPVSEHKTPLSVEKEEKVETPSLAVSDILSPADVSQQAIDFESMFGMKADINAAEIRQHIDKLFSALNKPDELSTPSLREEERIQHILAFSGSLKGLTLTAGERP